MPIGQLIVEAKLAAGKFQERIAKVGPSVRPASSGPASRPGPRRRPKSHGGTRYLSPEYSFKDCTSVI